jgi:aspartate dehydrogenase
VLKEISIDNFLYAMQTKIGIIGCGTIGAALAKVIEKKAFPQASLAFLCDRIPDVAAALCHDLRRRIPLVTIPVLIKKSDVVIEAASADVSGEIARESLKQGKQVLVMSVGGLLRENLERMALGSPGRLWIPSGALAGVDALLAAHQGKIRSVRLVTTKPKIALGDAPYFRNRKFPSLREGKPVRVFKGSARQAVLAFPQNINVAAILSLAGIGADKTQVEIWAAADSKLNQHEVTIEGDFGRIAAVTQNVPAPDNPKTSYLAVLSAMATLRRILSNTMIGT